MSKTDDRASTCDVGLGLQEPRWVGLEEIVESDVFLLREMDDVALLAESLIRHGQWEPVELRPYSGGLQLITGHRRLGAIQMLGRCRVLGRVHDHLSDEDALFLALAQDLDRRPWTSSERSKLHGMLEARGPLPPKVAALIDRAAAQAAMEPFGERASFEEEEVDADVLAASVRDRLADACNDLSLLHELWADLDEGRRADLVQCIAYLKDMYPFLVATEGEDP